MLRRAQVLGTADRTLLETRMKLETALLRSVELTVAATEHDLDELTRLGVPRDRVLVVPSGIDIDRFAPHGPVAERGETPRLVAYGEMVPSSGFETVIAALRGVPDAELIIIGGPLAGNPEAARLQAGARQVGVADRVTMLDSVEYTELPSWLRSADAVVHVPWDASVGALAALMGMACGVPVVISSIEEVSDAVVDGVTGVHLAPRRPDQLAVALRSLLNDPVRRLGFGVAGADRVRSRFSWPRVAADYERAYQRLLPIVTLEEEMAGVVDEEIDEAYQASSGSETV
jgi:glycosyltransferase involved in cell wall biosynthesis